MESVKNGRLLQKSLSTSQEICRSDLVGLKHRSDDLVSAKKNKNRRHRRRRRKQDSDSEDSEESEEESSFSWERQRRRYRSTVRESPHHHKQRRQQHHSASASSRKTKDKEFSSGSGWIDPPRVLIQTHSDYLEDESVFEPPRNEPTHLKRLHQAKQPTPQTQGAHQQQNGDVFQLPSHWQHEHQARGSSSGATWPLKLLAIPPAPPPQPIAELPRIPQQIPDQASTRQGAPSSITMPLLRLQSKHNHATSNTVSMKPTPRLLPAETVGILVPPPSHIPRLLTPPSVGFRLLGARAHTQETPPTPRLLKLRPDVLHQTLKDSVRQAEPPEEDLGQLSEAQADDLEPAEEVASERASSSQQGPSRGGAASPSLVARKDIGTSHCVDVGVQFDTLSEDEEDVLLHHGFAIQPGLVRDANSAVLGRDVSAGNTPRLMTDIGFNVTPRGQAGEFGVTTRMPL